VLGGPPAAAVGG